MKYTLKTIKKTKVYQANVDAVRAVYPGHEEDFARELMIAANSNAHFYDHGDSDLNGAFVWHQSPQDHDAWEALDCAIRDYRKEQNQNA